LSWDNESVERATGTSQRGQQAWFANPPFFPWSVYKWSEELRLRLAAADGFPSPLGCRRRPGVTFAIVNLYCTYCMGYI